MGKTMYGISNVTAGDGSTAGVGTSSFFHNLAMGREFSADASTEVQAQRKVHTAGSFVGLGANVSANTFLTHSATYHLRLSGSTGNLALVYTTGTTGIMTDTTHTDVVPDGYPCCLMIQIIGDSGRTITTQAVYVAYSANVGTTVAYGFSAGPNGATLNLTAATSSYYVQISGYAPTAGPGYELNTETNISKTLCRAAGILSNIQAYIISNANTSSISMASRVNGGSGSQLISFAPNTTGFSEDTTHSDTLPSGQPANYAFTTGLNTGSFDIAWGGCTFTSAGTNQDIFSGCGQTTNIVSGAVEYHPIVGYLESNPTEANTQLTALYPILQITNARVHLSTNGSTKPIQMWYRANGTNGNNMVSIPTGSAGTFEDVTHIDIANTGDTMNFFMSGNNASANGFNWTGLTLDTQLPASSRPVFLPIK